MSIDEAEQLKKKLTDQWVIVDARIPELRRFVGRTGKVKTINMNCRALVQFDGPADIGWYDIDTSFLRVVAEPPKKAPAHAEKPAKAEKPAAEKPAGKSPLEMARAQGATQPAKPAGALSPLELARQQGTGKTGAVAVAAKPDGAKKLSPLEMARQQGAQKPTSETAPAAESASESPPTTEKKSTPPAEGKKLSPLELARMQDAAKKKNA